MSEYPLVRKLQLKGCAAALIHLPEALEGSFPPDFPRVKDLPLGCGAVLGFAENREELSLLIHAILPGISPDAILWLAYPKKSSRRYKSDITRDAGWQALAAYDYEPVSQVALDEDWSALRFKHYGHIKNPARKGRMIRAGDQG